MASLAFRAGGPVAIAALAGLFVLAPARHDDRTVSASQDQGHLDFRDVEGPGRSGRHRLQLEHRAGPRRAAGGAAAAARSISACIDIAASVNPATVHVRSLTRAVASSASSNRTIEYDLLDPQAAAQKYVGREVTLVRTRQENGTTRQEEVRALLLSVQRRAGLEDRQRDRHRAQRGTASGFPRFPTTCWSRPTLVWTLDNERRTAAPDRDVVPGRQHVVERRLRADRRARRPARRSRRLGHGEQLERHRVPERARCSWWPASSNRVSDERQVAEMMAKAARADVASPVAFAREAFSEYHLYTLARRTTLQENETKQSRACSARTGTPVRKLLRRQRTAVLLPEPPESRLAASRTASRCSTQFRNDDASGLGMPMPAGVVRVYQADTQGRAAVRRRRPHRPHAEGRGHHAQDRHRLRRGLRAEADRLREDRRRRVRRWPTRSRSATTRRRRSPSR